MIVLVANPSSGGGKGRRMMPRAIQALGSLGRAYRVVVTEDGSHPQRAAREAVDAAAEAVVALGGDGLVSACANALVGTGVPLAIVPTGTGNDFARRLGLDHRRPLRSIGLLERGAQRAVDTVRVEGAGWTRSYVCVAGAGFDSETNQVANRMRHLTGTLKYVVALMRTLRTFEPAEFRVVTDDEDLRLHAMMVAVANAASYGGGMMVCPDAEMDDGLLDLCVVGAMSRRSFVAAFPSVYRGTHVTHRDVTMLRSRKVELEASRPFDVYADGERFGPLPVTLTVEPRTLEVIAP
ncbi:MAG TPA: diacylglycerol kinase family protein [Actinomycetota bacterium]